MGLRIRSACRSASTPQSPPQVWVVHTLSVPSAQAADVRLHALTLHASRLALSPRAHFLLSVGPQQTARWSHKFEFKAVRAKPSERLAAAAASLGGGRLKSSGAAGTGKSGGGKGGGSKHHDAVHVAAHSAKKAARMG